MKFKLLAIVVLIVGLFNIGISCAFNNNNSQATLVEVARVKLEPFAREITVTGSLRANKGIIVRPEIAGRITDKYFTSGQLVKAGTPLIQINKSILTAQLRQDQASLILAKQNYDRGVKLSKTHYISKADMDDLTSKLNEADAQVGQDQASLDQSLIRAPFAGRLGLSLVELGDYIDVGQDIVSLQAIDPIEIEFSVPEVYLSNLVIGEEVKVISASYPNEIFRGKIYAIDATINLNSRSILARATLPNPNNKLLPGGFAQVKLNLTNNMTALIIPQVAAIYDAGQAFVYKIVGNKVYKTRVILGERDHENVIVRSGLNANDLIVTAGQLNIEDGSMVKFVAQGK